MTAIFWIGYGIVAILSVATWRRNKSKQIM